MKNYFRTFEERLEGDSRIQNRYTGFRTDIFEPEKKNEGVKDGREQISPTIEFREGIKSNLDEFCAGCPAQYATEDETPRKKWETVATKLSNLDTSKLHYVKVPENLIVIDFDLKDENGNKSFEKNLIAASKWPATYAEVSKSGAGIHLHYLYSGNVSELSRFILTELKLKYLRAEAR